MRRLLLLALLVLAGCPKSPEAVAPPPPPAPPPPLPKVPPGCEQDLAGSYHHQDDATFRYDVTDDGTHVTIHAYRQYGQTREEIASSAATITLARTPQGLRGAAVTTAKTLSGARTCTVSFPYEVTACSPAALTLRTVHEVKLTEACQPEDPLHPDFAENVLVRESPPDAGAPPVDGGAGAIDAGPGAVDAGPPLMDAGAGAVDAGPPLIDAGAAPPADAGAALPDAGALDAGPAPADAGPQDSRAAPAPLPDAGQQLVDAGPSVTQGVDAGAFDAGRP